MRFLLQNVISKCWFCLEWNFENVNFLNDHFWHSSWPFVHSKCKRSSLRSQCWMRLFFRKLNTMRDLKSERVNFHRLAYTLGLKTFGNFPLDFKENVNRSTLLLANWFFKRAHSLQKSPKKSHCELVYILSGQKFIKNAKNGQFGPILENLKLAVKQCYQTCHY